MITIDLRDRSSRPVLAVIGITDETGLDGPKRVNIKYRRLDLPVAVEKSLPSRSHHMSSGATHMSAGPNFISSLVHLTA
jgi:hypothetical protein